MLTHSPGVWPGSDWKPWTQSICLTQAARTWGNQYPWPLRACTGRNLEPKVESGPKLRNSNKRQLPEQHLNNRSKHPPLWKLTAVLPRLQVWRLGLFDYFNFSNPALRISSKASELSLLTKKKKLTTPTLHIMVNNETHDIVRNLQAVKADSIGTHHRNENSRIKILSFSSVTYSYCKCRNNWLYIRKDNLLFK